MPLSPAGGRKDISDLVVGEQCPGVGLPAPDDLVSTRASLSDSISRVVAPGSSEQMIWVDALADITTMASAQIPERPVLGFIGEPMREHFAPAALENAISPVVDVA
jgi:hypothetical protein